VPTGTIVHLNGLPARTQIAARVVNCISLGEFEKLWILGLALDKAENVWGIEKVPEDWEVTNGNGDTAAGHSPCSGGGSGE
jgi:hypothetical protein